MRLRFTHDAAAFLARAGAHLAADPVRSTVVATVAERAVADAAQGVAAPGRDWWVSVHDAGRVVGAAMRTAPFVPRPAYVLAMPDEAARLLAQALHERGEDLEAVGGALPAGRVVLQETVRLAGGTVEVRQRTRLFELGELVPPRPVPGRLRQARLAEVELLAAWFAAFAGDADEQAGRERSEPLEVPDPEAVRRRVAAGTIWVWEDAAGEPVHAGGASRPAYGVVRIGPVYTPPAQRGRGWASNAVAEMSRLATRGGARTCLFTDQANPTSNALYVALGYRAVADTADLVRRLDAVR